MKAKKVLDILNETAKDGIQDEVGKFWVVTAPAEQSVVQDILFETNIAYLMNQTRGGLREEDILMLTKDGNKARTYAERLLGTKIKTKTFPQGRR